MGYNKKLISGYEILKNRKQLDYVYRLKNDYLKSDLFKSKPIFNLDNELSQEAIKQFFLQRILNLRFNESIITSFSKNKNLRFGLPKKHLLWFKQRKGFEINGFVNHFLWLKTVFFWYLVGLYFILLNFVNLIRTKSKDFSEKNFVYFGGLTGKNFPKNFSESKTIINWFLNDKNDYEFDNIYHNYIKTKSIISNNINIHPSYLPFNFNPQNIFIFKYLLNNIWISISSLMELFRGNPYPCLLLKEYPLLYIARKIKLNNYAKAYLFHNSSPMYKPLWASISESLGIDVIMYFYSTNNKILEIDGKDHSNCGHRKFMSWKKYFVWDQNQKKYIKSFFPNSEVIIKGPIWFESKNIKINNLINEKKIISVFDVQPYKKEFFIKLALPTEYYIPRIVNQFHIDINYIFDGSTKFEIILKRKRANPLVDLEYLKLIRKIYNTGNFKQIDPDIDAQSLIEKSYAVINMPSTSTALIAQHLGIKSIYYDPTGMISKNDTSLGKIPLISNRNDLLNWVNSI